MTGAKAIAILCMLSGSFIYSKTMGQTINTVNITISITPPYSPYYSDYSGANAAKVMLIVQNLTNTQKTIKLAGQLTGDNGVKLSTRSNYVPLQPIILNPNEVKKLSGLALKDIFDLNTLNVYGVDKVKIVQTSRLPEGNYNFCVQAHDYNNGQLLSANAPLGCTGLFISYPDAPILINPSNASAIAPYNILFNWMNPGIFPIGTQYTIQMAAMPDPVPRNPNQVLDEVSFPLLSQTVSTTSYNYTIANLGLVVGKRYAWRVKAVDPSGKIVFKNNGVSAASVFTYGAAPAVLASKPDGNLIPILIPAEKDMGKAIEVNNKYALYLRWKLINSNDDITSTPVSKPTLIAASFKAFANSTPTRETYTPLKYTIEITDRETKKIVDSRQGIDAFYYTETNGQPSKFVNGKAYDFKVKAYSAVNAGPGPGQSMLKRLTVNPSPNTNSYTVLAGESITGSFTYKKIPDTISTQKYITLTGNVKYQYDKYPALYPVSGSIQLTKYYRQLDADGKTIIKDNIPANTINANEDSKFMATLGGQGTFNVKVPLMADPKGMKGFYRIEYPENNYYSKPEKTIENGTEPGVLNAGEFVSKVLYYKLNLHISKGYARKTYNANNDTKVMVSEGIEGLRVLLYRMPKAKNVPRYEGQDTSLNKVLPPDTGLPAGATLVASELTKLAPGKTTETMVSFNLLLCAMNSQDLYWIRVYNRRTKETIITQQFNFMKPVNSAGPSPAKYYDSFKATGSYSYEIEKNLVWSVPEVPVATVKGRLLYRYSDGIGGAQPLANAKISLRPFIVLQSPQSDKSYVLPVSEMDKLTLVDENNEGRINPTKEDNKLIGYMNGLNPNTSVPVTTNPDGSFEFKDIPLWDSVYVSPNWYNFNIPFESIAEPEKQNPAGQTARDYWMANLLGDKDGAAALAKAFKDMVIEDSTNPLKDEFDPMGAKFVTIDPVKQSPVTQGQLNSSFSGYDVKLTPTVNAFKFKAATSSKLLNLNQGGPFSPDQQAGNDIPVKPQPTALHADAACKAKMVYRIVVEDESVYCSPDNDIEINPLQTLDAGILYSTVRTVKIKSKIFKGDEYKEANKSGSADNNPQVLQIPVHLVRKAIVAGLAGEGEKLNMPADKDKMIVDKAITNTQGITFNHVLKNKNYSLKAVVFKDANNSSSYKAAEVPFNFTFPEIDPTTQIGRTFLFNKDFKEEEFDVNMKLDADEPVIAGRVLNSIGTKGLPEASVLITTTYKSGAFWFSSTKTSQTTVYLDNNGYFSYKSDVLALGESQIQVSVPGYGPTFYTDSTQSGRYDFTVSKLQKGQKLFKNLYFTPSGYIKGYVINAAHENIPALYKIEAMNVIKETSPSCGGTSTDQLISSCRQNFLAHIPLGMPARLVIIPNDLKYFNDTLIIGNVTAAYKNYDLARKVITREHRINFQVSNMKGQPISGAKIEILGKILYSGTDGSVKYNFMNISEENFTAKVSGPEGMGYITNERTFTNKESKTYVNQRLRLMEGITVRGYVMINGEAAEGAEVYINSGSGASIQKIRTNKQGYYEMQGISTINHGAMVSVTASAGRQSNLGTILAQTQTVDYRYVDMLNFDLTILREVNIRKLLGFPVIVENAISTNRGYLISGSIDLSRSRGEFAVTDPDLRIGFTNIELATVGRDANGFEVLDAAGDVKLDITAFKTRFKELFNANVMDENGITIKNRGNGSGALVVKAKIVDNSFDFPRSYLSFENSEFYFAVNEQENIQGGGSNVALTNTLEAFYSSNAKNPRYYFTSKNKGAIGFKLLEFPAITAPEQTYFADGKIRLLPIIKPSGINTLSGPISVKLPEVFIDQTGISKISGSQPLEIDLDTKWKVVVPQWEFSTEEGGIVAKKGSQNLIRTGVLDIPFNTFRMRNDILLVDSTNLNKLSLGGIAPVSINAGTASTFGIDERIGSDNGRHYILRLLGSGNKAAGSISGLKGFTEGISIDAVTLVSNGDQYVDFSPNSKTVTAFNQIAFKPLMIESSPGDFTLMGNVDLGIPRLQSFYGGFKYTSLTNVIPQFKNIRFDIGKGYVVFDSPTEKLKTIDNNKLELFGTVYEPNNQLAPINVKLTKIIGSTKIEQVGSNSFDYGSGITMDVSNAQTTVKDKDWDYLTFTGRMRNKTGPLEGFKTDNPIPFKVYGEVTCDNGQLEVSNIGTAFGQMRLVFNWPKKELLGNLKVDNLDLGGVRMTGEAEIAMSGSGFYMFAAGDVNLGFPPFNEIKAGVLLGRYKNISMDVLTRTMQFNRNKVLPVCEGASYDLFGMLVSGRKDLFERFDEQIDLPPLLPLLSVGMSAEVGVDASMFMNFADKPEITLAVGAFGSVSISAASFTGTSASGFVNVDVTGRLKYVYKDAFSANFFSGLQLGYSIVQKIPFMDDIRKSGSMSLSAEANFDTGKSPMVTFELSTATHAAVKCGLATKK